MSYQTATSKPPIYRVYRFDGTQASLDEMQAAVVEGWPATFTFVDSTTFELTSWGLTATGGLDSVVMCQAGTMNDSPSQWIIYPSVAFVETAFDVAP